MKLFLILLIASFFLISSCTIQRKIYTTTQVNNPSLQKQGDYNFTSTYSSPKGFDVNSGYAISKHIGVIAGLNFYKNKDREENYYFLSQNHDSSILEYKHNGFHAGAGYFFPISKDRNSLFISFFAGIIKNKFEMWESFYEVFPTPSVSPKLNFYKSDIDRWFLQSSLNFYQERFQGSVSTRFNYTGYNNVTTDYTSNEQYAYNLPPFAYPKWSSFLDFSLDAKYFFNKNQSLGLQFFLVSTTRLNRKDFNFYYYPFRVGVGFVLKAPYHYKKDDK